jgi:hypothetical protein
VSITASSEIITGRYEVTPQQFAETLKDEPPENIQQFDLKKAFPDELATSVRLPRLAEKVWRKVLDEKIPPSYKSGSSAFRPVRPRPSCLTSPVK